ncbi:hypothetical protein [Methylosinus sp.]|jgi:hypothetical protein|uniref:hypothetical protein n=1 Tax=Methylosinus sp. TaxID=427 RepID=UPI002F94776D
MIFWIRKVDPQMKIRVLLRSCSAAQILLLAAPQAIAQSAPTRRDHESMMGEQQGPLRPERR